MNSKLLIVVVLLLVVSGTIARQCYKCTACPKPFKNNEAGVDKVNVGDNDYCQKTDFAGIENRDTGGSDCTPINKQKFCCKGDLCNAATTATLSVKLLTAMASVFFAVQFFH